MDKFNYSRPDRDRQSFESFKKRVLSFAEKANKQNAARIDLDRVSFWIDTETRGNIYKARVCGVMFCGNAETVKILVKFNGHKAII